ncbi:uncharacterized protein LOC113493954 [Trichoplusia ni]|uniref:Uncharacterized protein LOC113493954 n=1 Tax=Trichoplusia ni TaxID=7111 RepID=A0A7E5VHK3_TRINI|nr:uncharacterized protein LOC113493954 [Trichoplusia ni]
MAGGRPVTSVNPRRGTCRTSEGYSQTFPGYRGHWPGTTHTSPILVGFFMETFNKNPKDVEKEDVRGRRTTRSSSGLSVEGDLVARSPRVVLERISLPLQQEVMEVAEQTYSSCRSRDNSSGRSDRKRPRRDVSDDRLSVGAASDCGSEVSFASSTRSRGCVTHGRYVGLHRQREEYRRLAAESTQPEDTLASKEREEKEQRDARAAVRDMISSGLKPLDPASAKEQIDGGLTAVLEVARGSKNIKGTFIKKLKDAVEVIQGGVRALTSDDRLERLLAENARLSKALEEMQGKIQSVERRTAPASLDEEMLQRVMLSVGTMVDAKLAGVTSRLPPEPIMRPPLAADRRRAEAEAASRGPKPGYNQVLKAAPASKQAPKPAPRLAPKPTSTPKPDPKPAKGKAKKNVAQPAPTSAPARQEVPPLAPAPQEAPVVGTSETVDDGWTTVSNKKKKAPKTKAPEKSAAKPAKKTPPTQKQEGRKPSKGPKKESGRTRRRRMQRQRRLARTAAVVLTISEEGAQKALTYETVLREARETIDLKKMGVDMEVDPIRIRRTQTGARVLELPQNVGREAADGMAEELRARYGGDVRVTRPVRCAELRVSNLDDSVTQQEILDVAARQSQCAPDQLKVGDLRPSYGGKFSAVLKCPLEAASKLVTTKTQKFLVGWSSARVVQLETRPMKCFRCLALGHTRPVCMCPTDRSGLCYRCAMPGHKAAECKEPARCAICAELGRNAAHQMGSRGCAPPALIKKKMAALGKVPNAATSQARPCEEERMDE